MAQLTGTLAELGEFGLIDAISSLFSPREQVLLGPGDDTAVVRFGDPVLVSTDLFVEGRHFRRDWGAAMDVGHRAAAAAMADVAAMGGRATALVVGLAAPGSLPAQWAYDLAIGMTEEAAALDASVVGGDVTAADQVVIAVTVLGRSDHPPVTRRGAHVGDVVAVAGRLGWASAGLAVLQRGFRSPRAVVDAYRRPLPPYDSGPQAAAASATAMIDVSDGLLADLGHIARASAVAIDVRSVDFTVAEPLAEVGAALGVDPLSFCLTGGDDHALVATFPARVGLPEHWTAIGSVAAGSGVTVDGADYEGHVGHEHFR
ncbi:thiamine-phosphate kinase [soil metagenome]